MSSFITIYASEAASLMIGSSENRPRSGQSAVRVKASAAKRNVPLAVASSAVAQLSRRRSVGEGDDVIAAMSGKIIDSRHIDTGRRHHLCFDVKHRSMSSENWRLTVSKHRGILKMRKSR